MCLKIQRLWGHRVDKRIELRGDELSVFRNMLHIDVYMEYNFCVSLGMCGNKREDRRKRFV